MTLKKQAVAGVKWTFLQQVSVQLINFVVQIILARVLVPEEFGLIAMVVIFTSIGQTLSESGMTSSLIRSKSPTEVDYSTVFITNVFISTVIYVIVYSIAPVIAEFYNQDVLTNIIRLLSLSFIIRSLFAVHIAKLTKEMNFKLQMRLQLPSTILSGFLAVYLAYMGFGVWSLVWLTLSQATFSAIFNWTFGGWNPKVRFSKNSFQEHFNFGYKLTLSSIINTVYDNSYRIIIGKLYSPAMLGFYNLAETMRLFPVHQINYVVGKVSYPLFATMRDNDSRLKDAYLTSVRLVLIIVIPLMLSLILVAEEGFKVVFGEHWAPAVPFFQVLAIASIFRPISTYNLNIVRTKGRSDLFLKLEIVKKILGVIAIGIGIYFGIKGLVVASVIHFLITVVIDMHYSGKLISYSVQEQVSDIKSLFFIGISVYVVFFYLKKAIDVYIYSDLLVLLLFFTVLNLVYFAVVFFLHKELWVVLKSLRVRNNKY
ncbi:lipopolysaccharide biosynthesis protein [Vibrio breoganii]